MNGYIGHYMKRPDLWFFVLARSPEEAMEFVDDEWGEPDARSLRKIDGPMAFQFTTRLEEDEKTGDTSVECKPDEPFMSLGEEAGYEGAREWIVERMRLPFESPATEDYRAIDASVGERMSKEWKRAVHEPTHAKDINDTRSGKNHKSDSK